MDKIWAPWRIKYISKIGKKQDRHKCIFCKILNEKKDRTNLVIERTKHCFSVMNLYPYNNGHVLILPKKHVNDISKLTKEERDDLMDLLDSTKQLLTKVLKPQGFNIGFNLGRAAGAGFPGHLHMHVVPRWLGDSNFMPVVANTKVISQSLKALYKALVDENKKRH